VSEQPIDDTARILRRAIEDHEASLANQPQTIPARAMLEARRLIWAQQAGVSFRDIERELSDPDGRLA
jgi:hypothetical protein